MLSNRFLPALICCFFIGFAVLNGPQLGAALGKTPPPEEEAKRTKALVQEKIGDAEPCLPGSKKPMKLRGRNKAGDCPATDNKDGKKINPAD